MKKQKENMSLLKQVETEIAELLVEKLEQQEITIERASAIAKFALAKLPEGLTDSQVAQIIPSIDDEFWELADIVYKHMKSYEEEYKPFVLGEVNELVKHRHFDEASDLMKKYFERKIK